MKKIVNLMAVAMIVSVTFINNINAQSYYGQNGDVDTNSNSTNTCYNFSYDMRKGSRDSNTNSEVTKLQEALVQLGYMSTDPTGYFGVTTYNAVRAFQSAKGLLSSGFVGSYTRAALQSATCNTPNTNTVNNSCVYGYRNGFYGCYYNNSSCVYSYQNGIYGCYYNNNNNYNNSCTSGYMNGVYGCYYNVTCNSSYDYSRGYYVNNCTYLNGYENFIDRRNYDIPYNSYYNGTNIMY